jgi:hypothetical protein
LASRSRFPQTVPSHRLSVLSLGDGPVERTDRRDKLTCELHLQLLVPPSEPAAHSLQVRGAAEHPQRHLEGRVELV